MNGAVRLRPFGEPLDGQTPRSRRDARPRPDRSSATPWTALAAALAGTLVRPGDPSYPVAKQLYNERFDGISPSAIAYCHTVADVQRCVDFARRHGLPVAARSGGHSYGGYSLCPGLVVDVTRMGTVQATEGRHTVTVGAGARLIDVYATLGEAGLLLPGGSCPTVGIAGLTLGGGVSVFGRRFGLTCDHLRAVDLVTADGTLRRCSHHRHEDLFWASQGGGGGNFGVATSFTFDVHPIPPLALFTLVWPWAAAGDVLNAWLEWIPSTPHELWANCQLLSSGAAGGPQPLTVKVTGVFCGSATSLAGVLQPLRSAVGAAPAYDFAGPEAYLDAMLIEAGCEGLSVAACHLPSQNPAGTLSRSSYAAKSAYVVLAPPAAGISAFTDAVVAAYEAVPDAGGAVIFDAYGGAINGVPPSATAFVHRNAISGVQWACSWYSGAPPSVADEAQAWLSSTAQSVQPYVTGAYQNYIDPTLADWQQAYYGANLRRLVEIKRKVDPDDFFHFAQSIPVTLGLG
jgi:FAD/FMN-containing dehydrogenase